MSKATSHQYVRDFFPTSLPTDFLSENEIISLDTLLSCVAQRQAVRREILEGMIEAEFSVNDFSELREEDFYHAVAFLLSLRWDEVDDISLTPANFS